MSVTVNGITKLEGHVDSLYALSGGLEPHSLYSGGGDGYIAEWDIRQLKDARLLVKVPASVYAFQLLESLKILLIGTRNGGLHLVDLEERREKRLLKWSDAPIWAICPCQEVGFIALAGGDGTLTLLPIARLGEQPAAIRIPISSAALRSLSWNEATNTLYVGASDGNIYALNLNERTFQPPTHWEAHRFSVFALLLQPENTRLISGGRDALLRTWPLKEAREPLFSAPAHWYTINHLILNPDRQLLLSASRDKTIKIWNANSLELLKVLDWERYGIHTHSINRLCWFNNFLFSAGDDKKIGVWTINTES